MTAEAGPAAPIVVPLEQPDGATFLAVPYGDERSNGYETVAGYTVIRDDASGYWTYAELDASGQLAPSRVRADAAPPFWLPRHLQGAESDRASTAPPTIAMDPGGRAGSAGPLSSGSHPVLVLLVQFSDQTSVGSVAADWSSAFFGASGSVKDYYDEVSYGVLSVDPAAESHGTANDGVVGWLAMGYPHPDTRGTTGNANRLLAADAIVAADPFVNFASFDGNGDFYLSTDELHIVVVAAGYETSYGGSVASCTPGLWGHRWSLGFTWDSVYVGAPTVDGVVVGSWSGGGGYTQVGEWHCSTSDNPGHRGTIGILAHELGHDLDWPDLYDTDGSSSGVGEWSVMGYGSWNYVGFGDLGTSPAHPDAFSKIYQGWVVPEWVYGVRNGLSVFQAETVPYAVRLLENPWGVDWDYQDYSGVGEYFLIENRQQVGYDAGLPGCGLLIWHIDEGVTSSNSANADEDQPLVDLEEADGWDDLYYGYAGDSGDPYPGSWSNFLFSGASYPNSDLYSLSPSGVSVGIVSGSCAGVMTVNIHAPAPYELYLPLILRE
jgi:M6 family metalloprotease-like protein